MNIFKNAKIIAAAMLIAIVWLVATAQAEIRESMAMQGQIVVGLEAGGDINVINAQFGTTIRHYLPLLDLYLLDVQDTTMLPEVCAQISTYPSVTFCHPNYLVDPMRGVQSSLPFSDDLGTKERYVSQPAVSMLHLAETQALTRGSGQAVGVVDGGININHPAFDGRVLSGWDYVDNDADADLVPGGINSGHGTFVAGVIHLVAPDATIMSYRVCDTDGEADGFIVAEAILQAVEDGCSAINVSLSTYEVHQAIARVCAYARSQNVLVVCAAGNVYRDIGYYPGTDANTLAIAAVDSSFTLADYSDWGETISLVAPGTDIYSPYIGTGYAWWSGTSFAAPFVTAEIALLRSMQPNLQTDQLLDLLYNSAVSVDLLNLDFAGELGAGILNPLGAASILDGDCGDVTADHLVTVNDMVTLIDAMYVSVNPPDVSLVEGLDGHSNLTNNDLASLTTYLFTVFSPNYCAPLLPPEFPVCTDTIRVYGTEIPPGVSEWTVGVAADLETPCDAVSATLEYHLPGESITLEQIDGRIESGTGLLKRESPAGNQIALADLSLAPSEWTYNELAFLTFSFAPADTSRDLDIDLSSFALNGITYTSVVSRVNDERTHTLGWTPSIVCLPGWPEIDRYGHTCLGGLRGDVDTDPQSSVDIADLTCLIMYVFGDGSTEIALGEADVAPRSGPDGIVDIADVTVLIDHLFISLEALPTCTE